MTRSTTVRELRQHAAKEAKVEVERVRLRLDGTELEDEATAENLHL